MSPLFLPTGILFFPVKRTPRIRGQGQGLGSSSSNPVEFPEGFTKFWLHQIYDGHYDGTVYHFYIENRDGTLFPVTGHFWTYKFLLHCKKIETL